jgi:hypothetical protein
MKPEELNIGDYLHHNKKGTIQILGISPHCGDYKIDTDSGWVYLSNCTKPS